MVKDKIKSKLKHHYERALARGSPAEKVTVGQWKERLRQLGNQCVYCRKPPAEGQRLSIDHAIPLYHGGAHSLHNLVPACLSCNCSKGHKLLEDWEGPPT